MQGAQQTLAVIFSSMCTIAILLEVVVGAPLVVAVNRDELYARPARAPESFGDGIAGGVDVLSGGTWLAVRRDGRFAAVTNQRVLMPAPPGLRSRGLAVRELAAIADPDRYVAALDPADYASMNLVWGDACGVSIAYLRREGALDGRGMRPAGSAPGWGRGSIDGRGMRPAGSAPGWGRGSIDIERLPPGIHVLCNDRLGAAGFPRGVRLHDAIVRAPRTWPAIMPALERALADHAKAEHDEPSHLPAALAHELTATCIHSPLYGTRSSTIFAATGGAALAYRHADGPPCTTPFLDRSSLL